MAGFFNYPGQNVIPVFMTFSWAINTWAVFGLAYILGRVFLGAPVDVKESLDVEKRERLLRDLTEE